MIPSLTTHVTRQVYHSYLLVGELFFFQSSGARDGWRAGRTDAGTAPAAATAGLVRFDEPDDQKKKGTHPPTTRRTATRTAAAAAARRREERASQGPGPTSSSSRLASVVWWPAIPGNQRPKSPDSRRGWRQSASPFFFFRCDVTARPQPLTLRAGPHHPPFDPVSRRLRPSFVLVALSSTLPLLLPRGARTCSTSQPLPALLLWAGCSFRKLQITQSIRVSPILSYSYIYFLRSIKKTTLYLILIYFNTIVMGIYGIYYDISTFDPRLILFHG